METIKQIEKLTAILTNELRAVCYKGPSGIRWHDIGLKDKFKTAMNYVLMHYTNVELREVSSMLSSHGTPGNVANTNKNWAIKATIRDKECIFKGNWSQLGGASVTINDTQFLSYKDNYGIQKLVVYAEGLTELNLLLNETK